MITGSVISGSSEDELIVHTPALQSVSGMAKLIVSGPGFIGAFASWMASLSVQTTPAAGSESHIPSGVASPVSAVEFTVKVVAHAGIATIMRAAVITASKRTARLFISAHPLVVGRMGEESSVPSTLVTLRMELTAARKVGTSPK